MISNYKIIMIAVGTLLLMLLALSCGIIDISLVDALGSLINITNNRNESLIDDVIRYLRLPRFIMAISIGWGLAVCGAVMQAVMKNHLADPYLLGISSGASLGAIFAIIMGFSNIGGFDCVGIFAFAGAMITTCGILAISGICGHGNTMSVLLAGMAFNAISSAFINFIISIFADSDKIQNVTFWLMGSLLNNNWNNILVMVSVISVITIFFMTRFRTLNLMLMGDDVSVTLGRDITSSRRLYIFLSAIVVGTIVYNAGMIGFVGLIIPHIARLLVGNNHLKLLPASAFMGAAFLSLSDSISRIIMVGSEIPIGIVVSLFGSPIFVYLLFSRKHGYEK